MSNVIKFGRRPPPPQPKLFGLKLDDWIGDLDQQELRTLAGKLEIIASGLRQEADRR